MLAGEIEVAKAAVEKTAEVVEKVAEMAEKASEEVTEQLKDGKLKEAAEVVEHLSEKVEEDARMVEDIIHKVQLFLKKNMYSQKLNKECSLNLKESNNRKIYFFFPIIK